MFLGDTQKIAAEKPELSKGVPVVIGRPIRG
jgi:hypothetical protein